MHARARQLKPIAHGPSCSDGTGHQEVRHEHLLLTLQFFMKGHDQLSSNAMETERCDTSEPTEERFWSSHLPDDAVWTMRNSQSTLGYESLHLRKSTFSQVMQHISSLCGFGASPLHPNFIVILVAADLLSTAGDLLLTKAFKLSCSTTTSSLCLALWHRDSHERQIWARCICFSSLRGLDTAWDCFELQRSD